MGSIVFFLSKRSLYLVVWKITDGESGVNRILQWLVNVQARAANAPVIIVGTHYDLVKEKFPPLYSEDLQQMIRDRFINVVDADKCGLPRVLDTIEVSCKTRHNIKLLCNLIYDIVFDLRSPGSKERLLEQRIPATYLALEDVVGYLALERRLQGKDPVLRAEQYKMLVMHEMQQRFNIAFRDMAELNQATTFLHENGVLLHYEDATLKDLYFLDPQWLCDMLAHVVTIREINPFARNGIMRIEDLKHVFKSSQCAPSDAQTYILNLLNKFEVALTWDNRTLLIPSLLPAEEHLRAGLPGCDVRIPVRSRTWALRKSYSACKPVGLVGASGLTLNLPGTDRRPQRPHVDGSLNAEDIGSPQVPNPLEPETGQPLPLCHIVYHARPEHVVRRLLLMSYFPSGFWSRLMTRILADDQVVDVIRSYFTLPKDLPADGATVSVLNKKAEWVCWQTGMELRYLDTVLFRMKEVLPHLPNFPCDYRQMHLYLQQEGSWHTVDLNSLAILEILLPNHLVSIQKPVLDDGTEAKRQTVVLEPSQECVAKLLSLSVDHVDTLLEDWYPTLGTRFVHTSEGKFLVTRLVPCSHCIVSHMKNEALGMAEQGMWPMYDGMPDRDTWQMVDFNPCYGGEPCISKTVSLGNRSWSAGSGGGGRPSDRGHPVNFSPSALRKSCESRGSTNSHDSDSGVGPDSAGSSRKPSAEGRSDGETSSSIEQGAMGLAGSAIPAVEDTKVYSFMVEDCILNAYEQCTMKCPDHGNLSLIQVAPDTVFVDLGDRHLIQPHNVRRGKMLGRGAFGFVFKATVKQRGNNSYIDAAMKMLQPVDPGFGTRHSDAVAYKAAWNKWQRDPLQCACKAYCTARQELNILLTLRHPNIVPLVGVCTKPLALVLRLAPKGALDAVLKDYRRTGAKLDLFVLQKVVIQIAKALEYLHQQHIIYRDLKSENVLVWELPPPFHPAYPHPPVEVKLADYGISRATLPTGTKGFGGTEGFMAPEIMRYNGEEEYTDKVDCFSFGMFMYELVSLHLPFEGAECVKDHILDGGRPILTRREMMYPTYVLDLMTLCWSQQPKDRPSASQIVSIATAPEFVHMLDVVSLQDHMAVLCAGAVKKTTDMDDVVAPTEQHWEAWLSRLGKQMDVLGCSSQAWLDCKTLTVESVTITSLCVIGKMIWLGDSKANIHIYSTTLYTEICTFPLDPDSGVPTAIRSMCHLPELHYVAIVTSNCRLCLCATGTITNGDDPDDLENLQRLTENPAAGHEIRELGTNGNPIFCTVSLSTSDTSCELWCGQAQGSITLFNLRDGVVTGQEVVNHYDPVVDNLDVHQLVAGMQDDLTIWSYIYPGCVVYQWDASNRTILHKLDCSKLAPCSESIMSISIEEHLSPGRCQVTAMTVLGSELYIGTTWGCIVVAEGNSLRPITIFRPYEEEVKAIIPLQHSRLPQDTDTKCDGRDSPVLPCSGMSPLIATVGKGNRNLISRYAPLPLADETLQRSMYVILWKANSWSNT